MTTDLLYHYCTNHTLDSIVRSRTIRLCDLDMSNDAMEGRFLTWQLHRRFDYDVTDARMRRAIENTMRRWRVDYQAGGFCLSEVGDLLSQWRAYAGNGEGVAIGFERASLEKMCSQCDTVRLQQVQYVSDDDPLIEDLYAKLQDEFAVGRISSASSEEFDELTSSEEVERLLTTLEFERFHFKKNAFREEQEWRLLGTVSRNRPVGYFARGDAIVQYLELSFGHNPEAVREVVLGPKNLTADSVMSSYLAELGISRVSVRRSDASYR